MEKVQNGREHDNASNEGMAQDDEDGQVIVLPNSSEDVDENQTSSSSQVNDQQEASTSSQPSANNVLILQPTSIVRDHPLDSIIRDISRGVQTRSKLTSFCAHSSFVSYKKPTKIEEALKDADWVNAMHDVLNNFKRNQVCELVERLKGHNVIGTKWVFKNKQDQDGIVVRNKAKLVAQGYTQVEGLDFGEIYALVVRLKAIRILLAYACAHNIKLYQMDVKSVFLNGYINEEVYIEQPLDLNITSNPTMYTS
jgi:hypothetical protein